MIKKEGKRTQCKEKRQ